LCAGDRIRRRHGWGAVALFSPSLAFYALPSFMPTSAAAGQIAGYTYARTLALAAKGRVDDAKAS